MQQVTVIGAGVIGLTTALVLQEAGYEVEIYTKALPSQTTSAVAGAIWLPFLAHPVERVARWSIVTYRHLQRLAEAGTPGCRMVDLRLFLRDKERPFWAPLLPPGAIRPLSTDLLPSDYPHGWLVHVPMLDTPLYLGFLISRFSANGGTLVLRTLQSEADFPLDKGWVVNCTGLGAKALCQDEELYPVRGQLVQLEGVAGLPYLVDETDPGAPTYVFTRSDGILAGGTTEAHVWSTEPEADAIAHILQRCRTLVPALAQQAVKGSFAGLRPARKTVRLERMPATRLIHNYGHGGSGFTLAWGCAEEVLTIMKGEDNS